jgi:hypothetical protein
VDEEDSKIMLQNLCIRKYLSTAKASQEKGKIRDKFHNISSFFCCTLLAQSVCMYGGVYRYEVHKL